MRLSARSLFDTRVTRGQSTPMRRSSSEREKTSWGVPYSAMLPLFNTAIRRQYFASRATFCSMTMTVKCSCSFKLRRTSNTMREEAGSSAAVGSSSTITRGCSAKIAAIATFCFCPPDNVDISRCSKSDMPTVSRALFKRSMMRSWGTPKFSRP